MENSNIIKQAKSDIHKVLHPIITFYINKGAKPAALKKYYKNNKRFSDILDDIRNKGTNLVKDEKEYEELVREILNDMLNDFIAKDKDDEYKNKKMKHIKEFNSYDIKQKFNVGDYVYVVKPTQALKENTKYQIFAVNRPSRFLNELNKSFYYELKEIPTARYAEDRFISEMDYEVKKYNI